MRHLTDPKKVTEVRCGKYENIPIQLFEEGKGRGREGGNQEPFALLRHGQEVCPSGEPFQCGNSGKKGGFTVRDLIEETRKNYDVFQGFAHLGRGIDLNMRILKYVGGKKEVELEPGGRYQLFRNSR